MTHPLITRIDSLTSVRFLAALAVYFYHARSQFSLTGHGVQDGLISTALNLGFVGVPFFFVLSGFILTVVYSQRNVVDDRGWRPGAARSFYIARLARVYPTYIVGLVLSIPSFASASREIDAIWQTAAIVLAPLLMQAWVPQVALLWNGPGWSLSAEAFFYAIFPLLLVRTHRLTPFQLLIRLIGTVLLAAIATQALAYMSASLAAPGPFQAARTPVDNIARYNPVLQVPAFIVGVLSGNLFVKGVLGRHGAEVLGRNLAVILCGIVVILSLVLAAIGLGSTPYIVWHNWALLPLFASLILLLATYGDSIPVMTLRPLVLLGEASYAFYLIHVFVIRLYIRVVRAVTGNDPSGWDDALLCCTLCSIISVFVFMSIERPGRNYINNILYRRSL